MPKLQIQNFDGEYPRTGATFLADNAATEARNVRLYSGELRTWNGPEEVPDLVLEASAQSIYKYTNSTLDQHLWLTWDADVDVQKTALADTTDYRIYYTGDGTPKKTNWTMAGDNTAGGPYPATFLEMGVPAPTTAPTCTVLNTGSALVAETRFYVYTFISTFGTITEESAPSPPSAAVTIAVGDEVLIDTFDVPPTTNYNITHVRVYRTLPGEESNGTFVYVGEVAVDAEYYEVEDDLLAAEVGEPLATLGWDAPPAGLKGLTSLANGMMAGFVGNAVYFCEPYFHHAWPAAYSQSIPDQIVGLASYGNTLIVITQGQPWAMTGVSPDAITVEKIPMPEPCTSKKSIAVDEYGVLYVSPNGIVSIGPTGRGVISTKLFRRQEWQLYRPDTMVGAIYDGKYFLSYESLTKGSRTMIVSRDDIPALSFLDSRASAFHYDVENGELFFLEPVEEKIYELDADELNPYIFEWESKRFRFDRSYTWSVLRLDVSAAEVAENDLYNEQAAAIIAANQAITGDVLGSFNSFTFNEESVNGSILQDVPPPAASVSATVLLIDEDNGTQAALTVSTYDPVRIPGFRTREMRVRLTGNLTIRGVTLATSFEELGRYGT